MRLIDADDFIKKLAIAPLVQEAMRKAFNHMPTVDVVRCKDCRYYDAENHNCIDEMGYARIWNEDDYCSFAERREDDKR